MLNVHKLQASYQSDIESFHQKLINHVRSISFFILIGNYIQIRKQILFSL